MKPFSRLAVLSLLFVLILHPIIPAQEATSLWQHVTPGVDYRQFFMPGPNHVNVLRMERENSQVTLETGFAQGSASGGLETVRQIAERYDGAINAWGGTWNGINRVVAAVNGSYFDPKTGIPLSGAVHSGWYARRFADRQSSSGFAWTLERQPFIGGCIAHPPRRQVINLLKSDQSVLINRVNTLREDFELVLYTPQYGAYTPASNNAVTELVVEISQPLLIIPLPDGIEGKVIRITETEEGTQIPFDAVVLSAQGETAIALQSAVAIGDLLRISQEIRHFQSNCRDANSHSWTKTYAALGASYLFLRDGVVQPLGELGAILRNPRTAIAFNNRYVYLIVVDGRDMFGSLGMSMVELGIFARDYLAADWGAAMDGGGSSTMVIEGHLVNKPNSETSTGVKPTHQERNVANAWFVVSSLPLQKSDVFHSGQTVAISGLIPVNLRQGPGTNYALLYSLEPGTKGNVLDHMLNGVKAKDYNWWKVDFGGLIGWVSEEYIVPQP